MPAGCRTDAPEHPAQRSLASNRQEPAESVERLRKPNRDWTRTARRRVVHVEPALTAESKLLRELLPARPQFLGAADDPLDVVGVVGAADVGAGIAEAAQHRDRARRPFEPCLQPAVRSP